MIEVYIGTCFTEEFDGHCSPEYWFTTFEEVEAFSHGAPVSQIDKLYLDVYFKDGDYDVLDVLGVLINYPTIIKCTLDCSSAITPDKIHMQMLDAISFYMSRIIHDPDCKRIEAKNKECEEREEKEAKDEAEASKAQEYKKQMLKTIIVLMNAIDGKSYDNVRTDYKFFLNLIHDLLSDETDEEAAQLLISEYKEEVNFMYYKIFDWI